MKNTNCALLLFAVIMYAGLPGCIKQANAPGTNLTNNQGHQKITCSDWFGLAFQQVQYIRTADVNVPGISDSILKDGEVLVFARDEMVPARALPSAIGANYIGVGKHIGGLQFVIEGGARVSSILRFRY